jgi:hypothetical protein
MEYTPNFFGRVLMGLQKGAIRLVTGSKTKLFAIALTWLANEYKNNRLEIAQKIVAKLPQDWHDTATPEEAAYAIDITKDYVEKMYGAISSMRHPPTRISGPREQTRI